MRLLREPTEPDLMGPLDRAFITAAWTLAALAGATVYLPTAGAGFPALLWLCVALAGCALGRWRWRREGAFWLIALAAWLALTCLWSPASGVDMLSHGWHYAVLLAIPLLAGSVGQRQARLALQGFVGTSILLALCWLWLALWPFTPHELASTLLLYDGNRSISNGVLMALASALAAHWALAPVWPARQRWAWAAVATFLAVMVLWRSPARSAHLSLGVLALGLVWFWQRRWWPRLLMLMAVAALAVAMALGGGGLGARAQAGQLDTSNQQRWMVYSTTAKLVLEHPIQGHGLGSWETLWPTRSPAPELRRFNTAHSAPLELLAEGGLVALGLLLGAVLAWAGVARRAGVNQAVLGQGAGTPLAWVLLAWGVEATFNAALRDAAFAAPMIVLTALALAAAGKPGAASTQSGSFNSKRLMHRRPAGTR